MRMESTVARSLTLRFQDRLNLNTPRRRQAYVFVWAIPVLASIIAGTFLVDFMFSGGDPANSIFRTFVGYEPNPCMKGNSYVMGFSPGDTTTVDLNAQYPECIGLYPIHWGMYSILAILLVGILFLWSALAWDQLGALKEWMSGPRAQDTHVPQEGDTRTLEEHLAMFHRQHGEAPPDDNERFKPPVQPHD